MRTIDADAHVIETEHTWDYLDPADAKYRPVLAKHPTDPKVQYWIIDGKVRGFRFPTLTEKELSEHFSAVAGREVTTPLHTREMDDVDLRLRHLDQVGVNVQVLHNTLYITQVTDRPEVEVALCWAWNRWMADVWKKGNGRLVWSCVLPLLSMEDALKQMKFARQNGAVAVLMRPIEGDKLLFDPAFFPVYEEASQLDMAIAIHIANGNPWYCDLVSASFRNDPDPGVGSQLSFRLPTVGTCLGLLRGNLPNVFPKLRWALIEAGAQWVPYAYHDTARTAPVRGKKVTTDIFRERRIYATCETDEDIPYIIRWMGEDNLVIGTDYGHTDPSSDVNALQLLRQHGELSERTKEKILYDNPARLFGL